MLNISAMFEASVVDKKLLNQATLNNPKNWKSVTITHAGLWIVCKQYIILSHLLSEKNAFLKPIVNRFSHMTHQIEA